MKPQAPARVAATRTSHSRTYWILPPALALALVHPGARADDAPPAAGAAEDAAPIVITATRTAQRLEDALPSVTVITRADIERDQASDLVDLLGRVPGVDIARAGGAGAQASLFLRGANSNHVLVLVDGMPINSAIDGAPFLSSMATGNVERIEVVRGNLSSLYGSAAIGGVIQIFTRTGTAPGAQALVEAGQGDTRAAQASVTAPLGPGLATVVAGARMQEAISAMNPAQAPVNPNLNGNHERDTSLRWDLHGSGYRLGLSAWEVHSDTSLDDPSSFSLTVPATASTQTEFRTQRGYGATGALNLGPSQLALHAGQSEDNFTEIASIANADANAAGGDANNFAYRSLTRVVNVQDTLALARGVDLVGGIEYALQHAGSTEYDPSGNNTVLTVFARHVESAWAGTTGHRGDQDWQLNVRRDLYSDFGGATTGLAGWGWSFLPGWKLTAQWSDAFRAPTLQDLYAPYSGNPALKPERARAAEIGLRWSAGIWHASVAAFHNHVADLIVFNPLPPYTTVNAAQAILSGSEWQAGFAWQAWRLDASLSLDQARQVVPAYAPLLRRPHVDGRLAASYVEGPWSGSVMVQRTGARADSYFNPVSFATQAEVLPEYTLARAAASYTINPHLSVRLRVENLLNTHYETVYAFNSLPRLVVVGVEARY